MVIDLAEYLERRRRTAEARVVQLSSVRRVARQGGAAARQRPVRWANVLPLLPALDLASLYAEASLI